MGKVKPSQVQAYFVEALKQRWCFTSDEIQVDKGTVPKTGKQSRLKQKRATKLQVDPCSSITSIGG
jgi:hypothetical protein